MQTRAVAICLLVAAVLLPAAAAAQAQRPQMAAADAARHTRADHLAQGAEPWQPAAPGPADWALPDAVVAADGSGSHRSLQAAIDAMPATAGRRQVVQLRPGVYRGPVCIRAKAPLLLVGVPDDPGAVVIVDSRYNAQPKRPGIDAAHPCHPDLAAASIGTPGSATLVVASDDVQLAHLTVENDAMARVRHGAGYPPGVGESGGAQAVALMVQADRVLLHRVQLLGHQDTLFVRHPPDAGPAAMLGARVLVQHSLIAGDVDFIFGDGNLVIDDSTIRSRAGRRTPGSGGHVLAPSTRPGQGLGFLVQNSRFMAEPGLAPGRISLGRAWDEGVARGTWQPGASPNGQALVRDSAFGPHIAPDAPWSASTSRRPFAADGPQANRFAEFNNRPGPALAAPTAAEWQQALAWARQP
ncbi:MAG: pectinesterase family protein, partial [Aquabacterium sp.]|nr:pectinesterase family protein [Aquabacterium sp.]